MENITRDMTFGELLDKYPEKAGIPAGFGLHCHGAVFDTIEQGAMANGLEDAQIDEMIEKLNA